MWALYDGDYLIVAPKFLFPHTETYRFLATTMIIVCLEISATTGSCTHYCSEAGGPTRAAISHIDRGQPIAPPTPTRKHQELSCNHGLRSPIQHIGKQRPKALLADWFLLHPQDSRLEPVEGYDSLRPESPIANTLSIISFMIFQTLNISVLSLFVHIMFPEIPGDDSDPKCAFALIFAVFDIALILWILGQQYAGHPIVLRTSHPSYS